MTAITIGRAWSLPALSEGECLGVLLDGAGVDHTNEEGHICWWSGKGNCDAISFAAEAIPI